MSWAYQKAKNNLSEVNFVSQAAADAAAAAAAAVVRHQAVFDIKGCC